MNEIDELNWTIGNMREEMKTLKKQLENLTVEFRETIDDLEAYLKSKE